MKSATLLASLTAAVAVGIIDVATAQLSTSTRLKPGSPIEPRKNLQDEHILEFRQEAAEVVIETKLLTTRVRAPPATSTANAKPTATAKEENKSSRLSASATNSAPASSPSQSSPTPSPSDSVISTTETDSDSDSESTSEPTPTESTTSSEASLPDSENDRGGSISAGTAAGIAAGAVAGLALIGLIVFLIYRRRKGPIRGAVVTADYPDTMGMVDNEKDMGMGGMGGAPSLPDIEGLEASANGKFLSPRGVGFASGVGPMGSGGEDSLPSFPTEGEGEYEEVPLGAMAKEADDGAVGYSSPPPQQAGMYGYAAPLPQQQEQQQQYAEMPTAMAMAGTAHRGHDYSSPPQPQQQFAPQPGGQAYSSPFSPQQQQAGGFPVGMAVSSGQYHSYTPPKPHQQPYPNPEAVSPMEDRRRPSSARPVSAYLQGYPSPGNPPILPVSPLSTYYPDRQSSGPAPHPLPISPYYPGANDPAAQQQQQQPSPDLPRFMIPGGNRSRAMSYSSQYAGSAVGGFEDGNNAPPPPPVPAVPVMDSDGEQPLSPLRRNPYEAL